MEKTKYIYNVLLSENGYYTGTACLSKYSRFDNGIDVAELPPIEYLDAENEVVDELKLKSHKLVDGTWIFDENRYTELVNSIPDIVNIVTTEQKVEDLETQVNLLTECLLEISETIYA